MPKTKSIFVCQQCGFKSSQFYGKCPECGTWNSLVEQVEIGARVQGLGLNKAKKTLATNLSEVVSLANIDKTNYPRLNTNLEEFDRVLGGGIVVGSVVLVSGDPGIGKSTLLTQLALNVGGSADQLVSKSAEKPSNRSADSAVLYVAGEESAQQIKIRAERIQKNADFPVLNEVDVDVICAVIENIKPKLVIIDSIQTLQTTDLESAAGSVSQVRECSHRLQKIAKSLHIPIFIVGHVTKEGTVAGPRTLEHLVDVVLTLEGDSSTQFRILRANKNRFGPTDEVGIFEMEESGMKEIKNPSELFLTEKVDAPGSAVVAIVTGIRPMLVEIQALVTKSYAPIPRRVGTGIDNNRLQLLVAVLQKRLKLPLFDQDIFVNVTGGMKVVEPAADLGICMAIISSFKDQSIKKDTLLIGEVGLLGELRAVKQLEKRINEAKKLGYKKIITSLETKTLSAASSQLFSTSLASNSK